MYHNPKMDKAFFTRRTKLLNRFKNTEITDVELIKLKQCTNLLYEYIFQIKLNRKIAKGGKMTAEHN